MTETDKKQTLREPIPVDGKKLIDGLGTIFGGVIQLLNSMEPSMAQQLADMAINGVPRENVPPKPASAGEPLTDFNPDDFEEIISPDDLPWDTEPEQPTAEQQTPTPQEKQKKTAAKKQETTLTPDDLIRVVTQKIKQNRANKDKILTLLKTYGAAKVSDIPAEQYEAFLTDVSQL